MYIALPFYLLCYCTEIQIIKVKKYRNRNKTKLNKKR